MVDFGFDWSYGYRRSVQYIDYNYRLFARWWMKCGPVPVVPTTTSKPLLRANATIPKVVESLGTAFRTHTMTESAEDVVITVFRIATALIVASVIYYVLLKLHNSLTSFFSSREYSAETADVSTSVSALVDPATLPVHNPIKKSSRTIRHPVCMSKPVPVTILMTRNNQVKSDPKENSSKHMNKSAVSATQISDPSERESRDFLNRSIIDESSSNRSSEDLGSEIHRRSSSRPDSVHRSPNFTEVTEKTQRGSESTFSLTESPTSLPQLNSLSSSSIISPSNSPAGIVVSDTAATQNSDDATQRSEGSRSRGGSPKNSPEAQTPTYASKSSPEAQTPTYASKSSPEAHTPTYASSVPDDRMKGGASSGNSCETVLKSHSPKNPPIGILQMYPNSSMQAGCSECQMRKLYSVLFKWHDSNAQSVFVTGTFLNWESKIALFKDPKDGGWSVEVKLPRGHHEFKFIVDKRWAVDHKRQPTIRDKDGDWNNVIHV